MRRLGSLIALLAALCVVALPAPARAQDTTTQKQRREAKRLFNQAHLAYRRGDYEEAILKWEQSYELSQEPLIFLSIANAYERLGDVKQTLENLRRWRAHAPAREHKELDSRIEALEERQRKIDAEDQKRREEEARRQAEREAQLRAELEAKQQRDREEATSDEGAIWKIVGWSMVGTGGAALITGLVVDAVAAGKRPAEADACAAGGGRQLCRDALRSDIESSNTLAIAGDVTWIAGSAVAVGGVVVLLVLGYADDDGEEQGQATTAPGWSVTPLIGSEAGGVVVSAHF